MRKLLRVACLMMGALVYAGTASAVPVTFQGGEFDVSVTDMGSNVYRFVYTADFTGWDDTTNDDFITAIDFGLSGWNDVATVSLFGYTAPGVWQAGQGNASANNCDFKDNVFKICAQENPLALAASTEDNKNYSWTVDVTYNTLGDLDALTGSNPIKAVFYQLDCKTKHGVTTCEPKQAGNMSLSTVYNTTTTPTTSTPTTTTSTPTTTTTTSGIVPEPTLLSLFGAGIALAGRRLRRSRAA